MKRVVRAVFAAAVFAVGCGSAVGFGLSAHAAKVDVDFSSPAGAMRPLHGVNNAPIRIEDPKATQHELAAAVALNVSGADGEFRLRRIDAGHPKLTDCGVWKNGDKIQMPDDSVVLLLQ